MVTRRVSRLRSISTVYAILLITLSYALAAQPIAGAIQDSVSNSTVSSTSSAATFPTGQLTIDKSQFENTVPSSAIIGENYTLRVQIQSSANITVPVIVRVIAPVGAIFVHPQILRADIPPMGSILATFTIVPFVIWHQGPMNVTASVSVWFINRMTTPQVVDQATGYIFNISHSVFPYSEVLLLSAAAIVIVLVVVFYPNVFHKRGNQSTQSPD